LGFDASSIVVILTQETAALADVSPARVAKHYAKQLELPSVIGGNSSIHFCSSRFYRFPPFSFQRQRQRQNGYPRCRNPLKPRCHSRDNTQKVQLFFIVFEIAIPF
jgi:hypothetical protein